MLLDINGIGSELQGVGRAPDGHVVFVRGALPGETVRITLTKRTERFSIGQIDEIVAPSPMRVSPPCPLYGQCGGCSAQHMTYEYSLELKHQIITQQLERIGGVDKANVMPVTGMSCPLRYRNKAEFSISRDQRSGQLRIGQCAPGTNDVIDTPACLLHQENIMAALEVVRARLQADNVPVFQSDSRTKGLRNIVVRTNAAGEIMIALCGYPGAVRGMDRLFTDLRAEPGIAVRTLCAVALAARPSHAMDGRVTRILGDETLDETLCGLHFSVSPQSFSRSESALPGTMKLHSAPAPSIFSRRSARR